MTIIDEHAPSQAISRLDTSLESPGLDVLGNSVQISFLVGN